jgi:hypothetical protein
MRNNAVNVSSWDVYSYVFDGGTLISEGRLNDTWNGGWDANAQKVLLVSNDSTILTFVNRVKEGTSLGSYRLRVRAKAYRDITKTITVVANATSSAITNCTCLASGNSSQSSLNASLSGGVQTDARNIQTNEDPLVSIRQAAGEAVEDFRRDMLSITGAIVGKIPKSPSLLSPEIVNKIEEGFISAIKQIIRS